MTKKKTPGDEESQFGLFQIAETPNAYRKAVQVVHSKPRAPLSLLQRKLSNAWLKNAVETSVDAEGWWTINVASMTEDIGFDSHNREYLRNSALELMRIVFEWDVIAPEKKRVLWKASVLFPEVEIRGDRIRYQISSQLRERVLNPDMYALIDLNVVRKFRRASSLAIYEHCIRFVTLGHTAEVEWEKFRDIALGESAESKSYKEYKYFKQKVLKPAIAEINSESDITVELREQLNGRRIEKLLFLVEKKSAQVEAEPADEKQLELVGEVVRIGVPQSEAKKLVKQYPADEMKAALDYTRKRSNDKKAQKLENPAAYFRQALTHKWGLVDDIELKGEAKRPRPAVTGAPSVEEAFALRQMETATGYFKELDVADQDELIHRYNEGQPTPALQIKKSKSTRASQTAFFKWLALDTWGPPTPSELLQFAQELLNAHSRASAP